MILADKIINERKKNGWSQEELAEELGVSRQAVSKWESAQSVPDIQRVIQMAEVFGVSTDYLLRDEMEPEDRTDTMAGNDDVSGLRKVTMEEANAFLDGKRHSAASMATAVMMCVLSPVVLIFLAGVTEAGLPWITEAAAAGIGLLFLFGLIAAAVYIFITNDMREKRFAYLEREYFETEYGVTGMVRERKNMYESVLTKKIAAGVVLCILSAVPLVIGGLNEAPDFVLVWLAALLLVIVAAGVYLIVHACIIQGSLDTLLEEGDFTRVEKNSRRVLDPMSSAYWCIVTAVYLGWSFWTRRWDFTWLIWPAAGVLSGAVTPLVKVFMRENGM